MDSVSGVGVLDKAMAVVEALEREPLDLAALVAATGLPRATAHRLAVALEAHGLVARDGEGRFTLGPRLAGGRQLGLAEQARPALERLRDRTGESVQLYVRSGERRVCVAALESSNELRTIVTVGASLPLDRGSGGTVLRGDPAALRRGWAQSVAEREAGVASVSAPVLDVHGEVRAAVSVSGPIDRLGRSPGRRYGAAVAGAGRAIERASRNEGRRRHL